MSYKKDIQRCQEHIQKSEFQKALTLSNEIISSLKSSDDDKDKPFLYLAFCIKGLVHFSIGKEYDSIFISENEHFKESESAYIQANEIENTKFQSYKGQLDLYIYIQQKLTVDYKYILGFYDESEINTKMKEYHEYYKEIMVKISKSIDGFINSKGGNEKGFLQLRLKKLEYLISSGNLSEASKYVNTIRQDTGDIDLSKDSKISQETLTAKLFYLEMLSLFGILFQDITNATLIKSIISYFKSNNVKLDDNDRSTLFNIYLMVLIFGLNKKDDKSFDVILKIFEDELEQISHNSISSQDILQDPHTSEHLILTLLRLGNIKNFKLLASFEIYETLIDQNFYNFILSYIHLYPYENLSKILYYFLNKHKWIKKEEERDQIILFIKKTITNIPSTSNLRNLSLRILGLSILSLCSRNMNSYKATIDYSKEGLELIKQSNFSHPYFYIIFHIILGQTLRSNQEKILTYENVLDFDPENPHASISLGEIFYSQKEYEKCKEYYIKIVNNKIFGDLARARVLWIDTIPFILLNDKNTIIHSLEPLYKSYSIDVSRKDYILKASKAIEGMNEILEKKNLNDRIKSWILFWIGRLEWALNHYEKARDLWVLSSNIGLPLALAFVGHYYENSFNNHKYMPDLEKAKECYRVSLKRYEKFRQNNDMIKEGVGDGAILQEAAIPLLEILTTQSLDKSIGEKEKENLNNQIIQLLTSLSDSGVHWALFKMALCRMREKQYHLALSPLQNYIRRNPKDIDAWICLSDVYTRLGKYTAALKISEKVYEDLKDDVNLKNKLISLYQYAIIKMKMSLTEEAMKYFKYIIHQIALHKNEYVNDIKMKTIDFLSKFYLGVTLFEEQKSHLQEGRIIDLFKCFKKSMKYVKELEKEVENQPKLLNESEFNISTISLLKLIGDIYTFSYHLRGYVTIDENNLSQNTGEDLKERRVTNLKNIYNVVKRGSRFYFNAIQHDKERHNIHYDLSINYLYQAHILNELIEHEDGNQSEILLLYDQSINSMRNALSFDVNNSFYWTTLGNICSLYLHQIEIYLSKDLPLPSNLAHIPLHNITQKYFLQAIKLSTKIREQSVFIGYAWSSMLLFWMMNLVEEKYIKKALDFILNIDPLNPLLRGIESIILYKFKIDRKEFDGDLRGHIENYLNHLEHTISLSHEFFHNIYFTFIKEYARIFCRYKNIHNRNYGFILNNLLRYIYINPTDIEANNLIGNIASIAGLNKLTEKFFHRASVLSSKSNVKYDLNLALSLEKNGKFEEANKIYEGIDHLFAKMGKIRTALAIGVDKEKANDMLCEFLKTNLKTTDEFYNFALLFFTKTLYYYYYKDVEIDKTFIDSYLSFVKKSIEENDPVILSFQILSKRKWYYKLASMTIIKCIISKNYETNEVEETLFDNLNSNLDQTNNELEFDDTSLTIILSYYFAFIKQDFEKAKKTFLLCDQNETSLDLYLSFLISFYKIPHDKVEFLQYKLPFNSYLKHIYSSNLAKYILLNNYDVKLVDGEETIKDEIIDTDPTSTSLTDQIDKSSSINYKDSSLRLSLESVFQSPWNIHAWASLGYSYLSSNPPNNKPLLVVSKSIQKIRTMQATYINLKTSIDHKLNNELNCQLDILSAELNMQYYINSNDEKDLLIHTENILKNLENNDEIKNNVYLLVLLERQNNRLKCLKHGNDKKLIKQNIVETYKLIKKLFSSELPKLYETPRMILAIRMLMEISGNINKKMKEKLMYLANKWFSKQIE